MPTGYRRLRHLSGIGGSEKHCRHHAVRSDANSASGDGGEGKMFCPCPAHDVCSSWLWWQWCARRRPMDGARVVVASGRWKRPWKRIGRRARLTLGKDTRERVHGMISDSPSNGGVARYLGGSRGKPQGWVECPTRSGPGVKRANQVVLWDWMDIRRPDSRH